MKFLLFLIGVFYLVPSDALDCPTGWQTGVTVCYKLKNAKADMDMAIMGCNGSPGEGFLLNVKDIRQINTKKSGQYRVDAEYNGQAYVDRAGNNVVKDVKVFDPLCQVCKGAYPGDTLVYDFKRKRLSRRMNNERVKYVCAFTPGQGPPRPMPRPMPPASPPAPTATSCPNGWTRSRTGPLCFLPGPGTKNFLEAKNFCVDKMGQLLTVENAKHVMFNPANGLNDRSSFFLDGLGGGRGVYYDSYGIPVMNPKKTLDEVCGINNEKTYTGGNKQAISYYPRFGLCRGNIDARSLNSFVCFIPLKP